MLVQKSSLMRRLRLVGFALSKRGLIECGDSIIWKNDRISVFNGECYARVKGITGIDLITPSEGLESLLNRFPDDRLDIRQEKNELVIKGEKKQAGVYGTVDTSLPWVKEIPKPGSWKRLSEETLNHLTRAAGVCGVDQDMNTSSCIHISKNVIEATDNHRLYRWKARTGFDENLFLPASCVDPTNQWNVSGSGWGARQTSGGLFQDAGFTRVSMVPGWCYFKSAKLLLGIRGRDIGKYPDLDSVCKDEGGTNVKLPMELRDVMSRAIITAEGEGYAVRLTVRLDGSKGAIASKRDTGWYRESFRVKYKGPKLEFDVHPKLLAAIMDCSPTVSVHEHKIVAKADKLTCVIALHGKA